MWINFATAQFVIQSFVPNTLSGDLSAVEMGVLPLTWNCLAVRERSKLRQSQTINDDPQGNITDQGKLADHYHLKTRDLYICRLIE